MSVRAVVVLLLLVIPAAAQLDAGSTVHRMQVRIVAPDGVCDISTHVRLIGHSGNVADASPNAQCEVEFMNIPAGSYQLNVSGRNVSAANDMITVSNGSAEFEVTVKPAGETEKGRGAASTIVSAADLAIPAKAQKEFDKANELVGRQDFSKAIEALHKALAIYPAYAGAYNNLAVIYARLGDRGKERDALEKAISINDHFAPAYVNWGRMNIATGDFGGAETALSKAASFDPTDAMTFVLLAYSELMVRHFEQVIAASHEAHRLQGGHAFAHQLAARAYEQKRDGPNAIAELELFLREESTGPRADLARKELDSLRRIVAELSAKGQ